MLSEFPWISDQLLKFALLYIYKLKVKFFLLTQNLVSYSVSWSKTTSWLKTDIFLTLGCLQAMFSPIQYVLLGINASYWVQRCFIRLLVLVGTVPPLDIFTEHSLQITLLQLQSYLWNMSRWLSFHLHCSLESTRITA